MTNEIRKEGAVVYRFQVADGRMEEYRRSPDEPLLDLTRAADVDTLVWRVAQASKHEDWPAVVRVYLPESGYRSCVIRTVARWDDQWELGPGPGPKRWRGRQQSSAVEREEPRPCLRCGALCVNGGTWPLCWPCFNTPGRPF
jgi:hypothetical protein